MIIFFLTVSLNCIGQSKIPTEKDLRHTFKKIYATNKKENRKYSTWFACNLDSSFYKSDTVILVSNNAYYIKNSCCKIVQLSFYSRVNCFLTISETCKYPGAGTVTVATSKDKYKLKYATHGEFAYLILSQVSGQEIKFKAITSYDLATSWGDNFTVIQLVRVK